MNLKLVTFECDLTQFLVEANLWDDAIDIAIEANLDLGGFSGDGLTIDGARDKANYTVEDVDFNLLHELFLRTDNCGRYRNAIVFRD